MSEQSSAAYVRYVDVNREHRGVDPPLAVDPLLREGERVLTIETVKDSYGYALARVWIIGGDDAGT